MNHRPSPDSGHSQLQYSVRSSIRWSAAYLFLSCRHPCPISTRRISSQYTYMQPCHGTLLLLCRRLHARTCASVHICSTFQSTISFHRLVLRFTPSYSILCKQFSPLLPLYCSKRHKYFLTWDLFLNLPKVLSTPSIYSSLIKNKMNYDM